MRNKRKSNVIRKDTSTKKRKAIVVKKAKIPRVPKTRNSGTMTEAAFWQMIRSALRRKSMIAWKPIQRIRDKAKVPYVGPNKRMKWSYICSECKGTFAGNQIAVHHIEECGSLNCAEDLSGFVEKLFCEEDGLKLLCNGCHDKKHPKKEKQIKNKQK